MSGNHEKKPENSNSEICPDTTLSSAAEEGIVRAILRPREGNVLIEFAPREISRDAVKAYAQSLAPVVATRHQKCLMKLHGHACEACALKLEQRAERVPGIARASATYIGGNMTITFNPVELADKNLESTLREKGIKVSRFDSVEEQDKKPRSLAEWLTGDHLEIPFTLTTLLFLFCGWLFPKFDFPAWLGAVCFLAAYITGGWFGTLSAWQSLKEKTLDVDLLMILAALGAAYVGAPMEGGILLFLFTLSNTLQSFAIGKTRQAIQSLMTLRPKEALLKVGEKLILTPIGKLDIGQVVVVRPGEAIPIDGKITTGETSVDESSLTGEAIPVNKKMEDAVFSGSINQSGGIEVEVTRKANDSTIARLIRLVEEAQSEKARMQRFLDRAEQYYAAGVILFTLGLIFLPWIFSSDPFGDIFYRAMTVMVVASPCALIISTPASILSAIGGGARKGVLFKGGAHMERASNVRVVAFDKTGTITSGRPALTDISIGGEGIQLDKKEVLSKSSEALLQLAAAVEERSEHPLGQAIVRTAKDMNLEWPHAEDFQSKSGLGASAKVSGKRIAVGSERYFSDYSVYTGDNTREILNQYEEQGKTAVIVAEIDREARRADIIGILALGDSIREDVPEIIAHLKSLGIRKVVMLTGDNYRAARFIAKRAGIEEVYAEILPEEKMKIVRDLKRYGPVAMVGDGINDAPALAAADIGIAMGAAGTDVAMETADIVVMGDSIKEVAYALDLSHQARTIIIQNLVFALGVIVTLVSTALLYRLPLTAGVIGHEGSTVLVCLNGLRLLAYYPKKTKTKIKAQG